MSNTEKLKNLLEKFDKEKAEIVENLTEDELVELVPKDWHGSLSHTKFRMGCIANTERHRRNQEEHG